MAQATNQFTASDAALEIHTLMNTRPTLPRRDELEAIIGRVQAPATASPLLCFSEVGDSDLLRSVRTTIAAHAAAERRNIAEGDDDDSDVAIARSALWKALYRAQDTIPSPPRSQLHVLLHAEIAYHAADKDPDGITLADRDDDDYLAERSAARLIEAVLAFFGGQISLPEGQPCQSGSSGR